MSEQGVRIATLKLRIMQLEEYQQATTTEVRCALAEMLADDLQKSLKHSNKRDKPAGAPQRRLYNVVHCSHLIKAHCVLCSHLTSDRWMMHYDDGNILTVTACSEDHARQAAVKD